MKKKVSIFCSVGLGDGLIFFTIAENLYQNGFEVICYHNFLEELQSYFPHFTIKKAPKSLSKEIFEADLLIINSDNTLFSKELVAIAKESFPQKSFILHPSTCKGKKEVCGFSFDVKKSMVDNLLTFCDSQLHLKNLTPSLGLIFKEKNFLRKEEKRVLLHPTSNDEKRNWPKEKFLSLAQKLKKLGFFPTFMVAHFERKNWEDVENFGFSLPSYKNLNELAKIIQESGFLIGNDSGLGHLASALNVPTLILFATKRKESFWRPGWKKGKTLSPHSCLPNFKGLRLQEKYWQHFLSVKRVYKTFKELVKEETIF